MELGLAGRIAFITGGASGLGRAIAATLAAEGCMVWIGDLDAAAATSSAASIGGSGVALDVTDPAAVERVLAALPIDILVNSAGVLKSGPVAEAAAADWRQVESVNLSGVVHCCRAALDGMSRRRRGRIINIASVAAMRGGGSIGNVLYGATKAGVVALTMGLARELGPFGVTVNAIAPALAETPMTRASLDDAARRRVIARIPVGRLAEPSDIANLAAFLASDRADFINGAIIPVDGGLLTT